jgi:hypothetical protein
MLQDHCPLEECAVESEAVNSLKLVKMFHTTLCHTQEDSDVYRHPFENLRYHVNPFTCMQVMK